MNELQKEMKELENNKYWKYISTLGERAVVYNNRINKEINLYFDLSQISLFDKNSKERI